MKAVKAMYSRKNWKWVDRKLTEFFEEPFEVRVMARAEGYAMVRRKGCIPFVCEEKYLAPVPIPPQMAGASNER